MRKHLSVLTTAIAVLALVAFLVFLVNETLELVAKARAVNPLFGEVAFTTLITVYILLVGIIVVTLLRIPKPLAVPLKEDANAYKTFLRRLSKRFRTRSVLPEVANAFVKGEEDDVGALEEHIAHVQRALDEHANKEVATTAKRVFVSTAVSQSGSLDSIIVLFAQIRMVYAIAKVYNQRPSVPEILRLYGNVAATAFAARAIEDIDMNEIIDPLIRNLTGTSLLSIVPVLSLFSGSLINGSINALLTLRVGIIARIYCNPYTLACFKNDAGKEERMVVAIRKSSIREAGEMLKSVITRPSKALYDGVVSGLKKSGKLSERIITEVKGMMTRVTEKIFSLFGKRQPDRE